MIAQMEWASAGIVSAGCNAHVPVNSVIAVCEAAPGIRTTDELRLVPIFG